MSAKNSLHVGIDITPVIYGRGVSRYTANLIKALLKNKLANLQLFGNSLRRKKELEKFAQQIGQKQNLHAYNLPPKALSLLWYRLHWPDIQQLLPKVDVYHSWEELIPPSHNIPLVATIHDLSVMKYPQAVHPQTRYRHLQAYNQLKKLKAHVIAVSTATKKDILKFLEIPEERIHVIYEALPEERRLSPSKEEIDKVKQQHNVTRPYLLWVGTQEPRKNLYRIIEAWIPFAQDYDLVLAGSLRRKQTDRAFTYSPKVITPVSDQTLACLYAGAEVFVFPSIDEGFGLPILEAFHYKTPVVTANKSAMKEVAGEAAELVDPEDVKSITQGIEKILNEKSPQRTKRKQRMTQRLQFFNWDTVAQQTAKVYHQAVKDYGNA